MHRYSCTDSFAGIPCLGLKKLHQQSLEMQRLLILELCMELAFGLSEDLPFYARKDEYGIEYYFNVYLKIKAFLDHMVEQGHTNETI